MELRVFLNRVKSGIKAEAKFDVDKKEFVVLKGSIVSSQITRSEKFRGAKAIEVAREGVVKDGKVIKDITFKSASTAANFVTGASTNGLVVWKDKDGNTLKSIISED